MRGRLKSSEAKCEEGRKREISTTREPRPGKPNHRFFCPACFLWFLQLESCGRVVSFCGHSRLCRGEVEPPSAPKRLVPCSVPTYPTRLLPHGCPRCRPRPAKILRSGGSCAWRELYGGTG